MVRGDIKGHCETADAAGRVNLEIKCLIDFCDLGHLHMFL